MSVIADYLVYSTSTDNGAMERVNELLREADTERGQQFTKIAMNGAGGSKFFCGLVWAAAFNHLVPTTIEDCIAGGGWQYPAEVIVIADAYDYGYPPITRTVQDLLDREADST